MPSPH
ncbi:hypothetical protein LSH36_492g01026 [Paralvinella palmiformis]